MSNRNEYFLNLSEYLPSEDELHSSEFQVRTVNIDDAPLLAELMIDAYHNTIDYDGETIDDALSEVSAFLAGERGGQPWLQMSFLAFSGSQLVGACLTGEWLERQTPIVAYAMTRVVWKKKGIGRLLLLQVLNALINEGYPEVRAVITDGNKASEKLFLQLGFKKIGG